MLDWIATACPWGHFGVSGKHPLWAEIRAEVAKVIPGLVLFLCWRISLVGFYHLISAQFNSCHTCPEIHHIQFKSARLGDLSFSSPLFHRKSSLFKTWSQHESAGIWSLHLADFAFNHNRSARPTDPLMEAEAFQITVYSIKFPPFQKEQQELWPGSKSPVSESSPAGLPRHAIRFIGRRKRRLSGHPTLSK